MSFYFLADLLLQALAFRSKLFELKPAYKYEIFLTVVNVLVILIYVMQMRDKSFTGVHFARLESFFMCIALLRPAILIKYLYLIEDVRIISYTASRLATPFVGLLFTFYLLTIEFQVVGQWMFGGLVTYEDGWMQLSESGDLYIEINFNDFFGSNMVLMTYLVTNNWNDFNDLYDYVFEPFGPIWIVNSYFTFYFFLVALICLNIIISFVMEIYDSLRNDVEAEMLKQKHAAILRKSYPTGQGLAELVRHMNRNDRL